MTTSISDLDVNRELTIHPAWVRIAHWLNAVAAFIMVASGWRIYNASPLFELLFPRDITLGGWLGGALQWHFTGMWLLFINGLMYLLLNLFSGRLKGKFFPLRISDIQRDMRDALRGQLRHDDTQHYNSLQRAAYLFVMVDAVVLVISGLVLWKSVQFPLLCDALGGYELARRIHFFAMAALVAFTLGHLTMVLLVPRTLIAMIRGR